VGKLAAKDRSESRSSREQVASVKIGNRSITTINNRTKPRSKKGFGSMMAAEKKKWEEGLGRKRRRREIDEDEGVIH